MQYLMSRYGGHNIIIGKGKASNELLPEDQSLDNMLDNYAKEIIPNHFFISSYDAQPEYMVSMENLISTKAVKLGTLHHRFNEVLIQDDLFVETDIYITNHNWNNVYAIIIKTHKGYLEYFVSEYVSYYDYVLQVFIRSNIENHDSKLFKNPKSVELILLILFYKMGLNYEGDIESFVPSKTYLGKNISKSFVDSIPEIIVGIENDEDFSKLLLEHGNLNISKNG